MNTQLLCTFSTKDALEKTIETIFKTYDVYCNTIYVLDDVENINSVCCTYNIVSTSTISGPVPDSTISLHRKKATNTLYTINALNLLVAELNDGVPDKNFKIPWEDYNNTILVTAYGRLKKIPTKLLQIIKEPNGQKDSDC